CLYLPACANCLQVGGRGVAWSCAACFSLSSRSLVLGAALGVGGMALARAAAAVLSRVAISYWRVLHEARTVSPATTLRPSPNKQPERLTLPSWSLSTNTSSSATHCRSKRVPTTCTKNGPALTCQRADSRGTTWMLLAPFSRTMCAPA